MTRLGFVVAIVLSFCVCAPMARAQGRVAWKTIHTTGDPNITIDIPAGVPQEGSDIVDPKTGTLMAFFATADNRTKVTCLLNRDEYSAEQTQKLWTTALSSSKIGMLCADSGANVSHFSAMDSQPTTSNGFPAATCVSSYTKSDEKDPGIVYSRFTIAAPSALYYLVCKVSSKDQDAAIWDWSAGWQDAVAHIQGSLHLPDAKK